MFSAAFSPASQSVGENIEKFARFSILADFFELGYRIVRAGGHPWSPFDRICVGCIGKPICESSLKTAANGHQPSRLGGRASCAFFKNQIFILQKSDFHPKIDYRKPWFFRRPGGARMLFRAAHVKLHEILQLLSPGLFLCNRLHHVENRPS